MVNTTTRREGWRHIGSENFGTAHDRCSSLANEVLGCGGLGGWIGDGLKKKFHVLDP
jgi:hypothetical protein